MITNLKTALLGDGLRADGGWTDPGRGGTDVDATRDGPDVGETDPFRPALDSADSATHDPVEMDRVFGILGNQRRRYVLKYLSLTEGTTSLDDLTEQVAAWEYQKAPVQLTPRERKRMSVKLYQCDLPKMAEGSAISYDQARGEIGQGEQFGLFSCFLRHEE